ncbi:MAG: hypothetical protein E7161_04255 [Firmicutes bacterium]|nr:hypothetical protein [Bacillota bacterium]
MKKNYRVGKFELDDNQMQLLLNDNNSLVIAGAGSGKTLTILGKINYLIEHNICLPEQILIISFTNASVNDIKTRINYNVNVYTFHKLAMTILENADYKYSLCPSALLRFVIEEYIHTCSVKEQKIILKFLKINFSYTFFLKSKQCQSFCNLIETFINLFKTNNFSVQEILNKNFSNLQKEVMIIFFKIYKKYNSEKLGLQQLDFDDLIIYATLIVKKTNLKYKYIIIDEFQDTSLIRLNLIKEIYLQSKSKIVVVGDDWQSIYRFSGCDLNIFLNFSKIFPKVQKINLTNTYRNSSQLILIASEFIQKNPLQIKKSLTSQKQNISPIVLVPYKNKNIIFKKLLNHLIKISKNNIMILGRNNNDIFEYLDEDFIFENNIIHYMDCKINYYTVHRSKGLEAEHVIILNCNDSILGFPNKIENNAIINKLIPNVEIKFAEERRLFYVALTRCKETTYLVYNKNYPSIFLKEIKKIIKKRLGKISYFK